MRKCLAILLLAISTLVTGCVTDTSNKTVLYKFDKESSYSSNEVLDYLDDVDEVVTVNIVLKSDFSSDAYKALITPNMTADEVDRLIAESRALTKTYFITLNSDFIDHYDIDELGNVEYSKYSPFVTVYLGVQYLNEDQVNKILILAQNNEVEYIEVQILN